jgi:hypothetical protein
MFNVSNILPGFRVGMGNAELSRSPQNFDSPSAFYQMLSPEALLASNPYLRIADYDRGIDNGEADALPLFPLEVGLRRAVRKPRQRSATPANCVRRS